MAVSDFTPEELREQFAYNPETGALTYRRHVRQSWVGRPAAIDFRRGYARVRVRRKWLLVHRIAWVIQTGEWPHMVDHINGDRADNRWANLRETTPELNQQNRLRPDRDSKTGMLGAHKRKRGGFSAHITRNGQRRNLGTFATPAEAQAAYLAAKRELHPHSFLVAGSPQIPHGPTLLPSEFDSCRGDQT